MRNYQNPRFQLEFHCKEDTKSFIQTENGFYCKKCEEAVFDLTNLNNEQIVNFLANHNEPVCASFYQSNPLISTTKSSLVRFSLLALLSSTPFLSNSQENSTEQTDSTLIQDNSDTQISSNAVSKDTACREHIPMSSKVRHDQTTKYKPIFYIGSIYVFIRTKFPWIVVKRLVKGRVGSPNTKFANNG